MSTKQEQVEAGLAPPAAAGISTEAPAGSPLSSAHREAIVWLAETGYVVELELPGLGRVVLKPSPKGEPSTINLADLLGPKPAKSTKPLVVGGYDPDILFGAVDAPVPDLPNEPPVTEEEEN